MEKDMEYTCKDIAKMIDHSLLRPELTDEDIVKGFETAKKRDVATICCWPSSVALAKKHLEGSSVKVTTVIVIETIVEINITAGIRDGFVGVAEPAETINFGLNYEPFSSGLAVHGLCQANL